MALQFRRDTGFVMEKHSSTTSDLYLQGIRHFRDHFQDKGAQNFVEKRTRIFYCLLIDVCTVFNL